MSLLAPGRVAADTTDSIKRLPQYRFSSQLHYVNFDGDSPPSACAFDWMPPTTDTDLVADSSRAEVLSSVSNYTHRLAEAERGTWAESESLRFLVHYIEDIHQPLHRKCEPEMRRQALPLTSTVN